MRDHTCLLPDRPQDRYPGTVAECQMCTRFWVTKDGTWVPLRWWMPSFWRAMREM